MFCREKQLATRAQMRHSRQSVSERRAFVALEYQHSAQLIRTAFQRVLERFR